MRKVGPVPQQIWNDVIILINSLRSFVKSAHRCPTPLQALKQIIAGSSTVIPGDTACQCCNNCKGKGCFPNRCRRWSFQRSWDPYAHHQRRLGMCMSTLILECTIAPIWPEMRSDLSDRLYTRATRNTAFLGCTSYTTLIISMFRGFKELEL